MKRFGVLGLILVAAVSGAVALLVTDDADRSQEGSSSPKPEPTVTTAEFRSEKVGKYRVRVWPRSEDVANMGTYRFTVPHCGLEWMTDFDGSFWRIADRPSYGKNGPSFFINSDPGTLTFEDDDTVVYRASTGKEIPLHRLPGSIVIHLCA